MAHLVALGQEVSPVVLRGRDLDGHALDDLEAIAFDADDLLRIVGQDPQTLGAEIDGMPVRRGLALKRFGYFVMERSENGWDGTLYAVDDTILARCRLAGREIDCR